MLAAGTAAASVPITAFGPTGDVHVDFPTYVAPSAYEQDSVPSARVEPVGDVNGDGRADLGMAISGGDPWVTAAWIPFTPVGTSAASVEDPDWAGLRIDGAQGQITGLAGVGDVNGDGFGDVALAATGQEGGAWIVFGAPSPGSVDVRDLGDRGMTISGARPCSTGGGGNLWTGTYARGSSIAAIGDHNADGRADLALCGDDAIHVVYTPERPAGASIDVSTPNGRSGRVTFPMEHGNVFMAALDDTDGDGRSALVAGWSDEHRDARVSGVRVPQPGESLAIEEAKTFSLTADGAYVESLVAFSDHNADGRDDIMLSLSGGWGRTVMVAFTPPPGTERALLPLDPAAAQQVESIGNGPADVGDQDGDGRPDHGFEGGLRLSSNGAHVSIDQNLPECVTLRSLGPNTSLALCRREYKVASALPDVNGDGKPEIVAIHTDPLPAEPGVSRATWRLDVFFSAATPVAQAIAPPVALPDGSVGFTGEFLTAPNGPLKTLGALPTIEVTDAAGRTASAAGSLVDAGAAGSTKATVLADAKALSLAAGQTYRYRMALENGRGLVGRTATATFVYRPPTTGTPAQRGRRLLGTRRADRLRGTAFADTIRGRAGADLLLGLAGDDRLDGGPGRDLLRAGPGRDTVLAADRARDVVDCGPGIDTAVADRADRLVRCERVTRRR
jgi:hypothetical protein